MIILSSLFKGFSNKASTINAGPNVINTYIKEGGYFVTFKKEQMVSNKDDCTDHGALSPYIFIPRTSINNAMAMLPINNKYFFRSAASIPFLYNDPKQ